MLRPARYPLRLVSLVLLTMAAASVRVSAQNATDPEGARPEPVTAEQLETLRGALRAGQERLDPLMDEVDVSAAEQWLDASPLDRLNERAADTTLDNRERTLWQQAADHEQAAADRVRGALNRAELALSGRERLDEVDEHIETLIEARAGGDVVDERALTLIEQDITSLNSRRAQLALELDQRRQTLSRLEEQLRGQADTLDQLRRNREEELDSVAVQEVDDPALADAQAAVRQAYERRMDARIISAQLDAQTLPARIERLGLEVRALELEQRWTAGRLNALQAEYRQRSTDELRALSAAVARLVESEPDVEQRFADELETLRGQIDGIAQTQERIRTLQRQREEYRRTENDLTQTLANVRERLDVGGLTETLGGLFLEEQRRVRNLAERRFRLQSIEQELAQARLRNITLRERLRATPEPDAGIADDAAEAELRRLQREVTSAQVQTEETLIEQMRQTETRLRSMVAVMDELEQILRETLLWWPSHVPVSLDWAAQIPLAVLALLEPSSWQETGAAVREVTLGSPGAMLFTLLVVGLLYRSGRGAGGHLAELAEKTRHRYTDNIALTFKAMGWSLLRVLPVPVLLMSTAYRLEAIPETGPGVEIIASVLSNAAIWWLAGHLVLLFTSRNGVGTVHFDWNATMVERLRRHLAWYLPVQFILIICLALAFSHPSDLVFDVLGRGAMVLVGLLTGLLAWRLLAPGPEPGEPVVLTERKRRLLRTAAVTYAAGLVILALTGYLLTVNELLARTIDTAVVVGLVWLGYRLAARALILSEMRLQIRRMLEERAKAASGEVATVAGEGATEVPEPHLSIEDINLQTRTLVNVVAGGVMVVALFWVWADILPALSWLDGVTLWSRTVAVGDAEIISRISLQDVLLAVFLVVLFTMAARNLPGLVEIILTRSTDMDAPGRYTVATLLKYVIMVVAVVSVFSLLGLRWSELQWMVAALTLGLGFGLQEVVANFVSGLIMLFERPVRVGDTITIGEYSGTVARIRTRATTIYDWDNREIVVPNKMFITERLINWTLSDTMTRIIVPVSVSYDSDVELVMRTLREIADEHSMVLADPEPTVLFMRLGNSTLDFELRAYVDQLRDRLPTVSDILQQVIARFRELGIEIAYPQMDLHIRDLPHLPDPTATIAPPARAATTASA